MFLDEARLTLAIDHPNVVRTLDVVADESELFLVMEYVPGESLARLVRAERSPPCRVMAAVMTDALLGLHAAHEAKDARGELLHIVHRDVSPQNILVGDDGVSRILDFGVAKATGRARETQNGEVKGKLSYMAPEYLQGRDVSPQTDVYAAGVVLWEVMTNKRLFAGETEGQIVTMVLAGKVPSPLASMLASGSRTLPELDMMELEGLDRVTSFRLDHGWLVWLLPAAGLVIGLAYHHLGGRAAQGNSLLIEEIHQPTTWVPRRMAPMVLIGSWITHLFGGSAGREGTALQMSGSLADGLSRVIRPRPSGLFQLNSSPWRNLHRRPFGGYLARMSHPTPILR